MIPISLLCTISDDKASSTNLDFVMNIMQPESIRLTLLHVVARQPSWELSGERLTPTDKVQHEIERKRKASGEKILQESKEWLLSQGVQEDQVVSKLVNSGMSPLDAIIKEGHDGNHAAVVLGKRGMSWFDEMMHDSLAHKLMWQNIVFQTWVCRSRVKPERSGILLCVDGSRSTLRMADHVGFVQQYMPEQKITLFHVQQRDSTHDPERLFEDVRKELSENGVDVSAVSHKVVHGNPGGEILKEAERGGHAVVATGRNHGQPQALDKIFPSSVTTQLFDKLSGTALWVSR